MQVFIVASWREVREKDFSHLKKNNYLIKVKNKVVVRSN